MKIKNAQSILTQNHKVQNLMKLDTGNFIKTIQEHLDEGLQTTGFSDRQNGDLNIRKRHSTSL